MCMPIPRAPTTQKVFNATTGQQYRQATSSTSLWEAFGEFEEYLHTHIHQQVVIDPPWKDRCE